MSKRSNAVVDMDGRTARRLLAEEEEKSAETRRHLIVAEERIATLHAEKDRLAANLTEERKGREVEVDLWKATAEVAQDEVNRLTREEEAVPYLMDMIAERDAQIAALNAEYGPTDLLYSPQPPTP